MAGQGARTIVVVGARAAGKTSTVHRLIEEPTDFTTYRPTIDECYNITWQLPDSKKMLQVRIIDTAAWNEYPAMQSLCIKTAHLVLVVYDVTSPDSIPEMLSLVSNVKGIKADVDILVVGNKCDNLRKEDKFTPNNLMDDIGANCIGHMYTSAKTEQGIMGLKQLILCTKSKLTEGFYTEVTQMPKRRKLKKKLHGIAINLHKRKFKKSSEPTLPAAAKNRSANLSLTPTTKQAEFGNYNQLPRHSDPQRHSRHTLNTTQQRLSQFDGEESIFSDHELWMSSGSQSDYSTSPCGSPKLGQQSNCHFNIVTRRKSMDFSKLELVTDPFAHRHSKQRLSRKISVSCGNGEFVFQGDRNGNFQPFANYAADDGLSPSTSNPRTVLSDCEDDVSNNSQGSSSAMTILLNNMSLDRNIEYQEKAFVKSTEHLSRNKTSRKSVYCRSHSSADDLFKIRQETLVRQ